MRKSSALACNQCSPNGRNVAWALMHLAGIFLREQKRKTQQRNSDRAAMRASVCAYAVWWSQVQMTWQANQTTDK